MPSLAVRGLWAPKCRYAGAVALAAAIFAVDSFTMLASAVAVLYVLVLILISDLVSRRALWALTAVLTALTLFSYFYGHGLELKLDVSLRLAFSLCAILATAFILIKRQAADEALRRSEQRYRTIFETLAVAIWEHDLRPVKAALDGLTGQGVDDLPLYFADHPEFLARMRGLVRVNDVNGTALRLMGVPSKEEFFQSLDEFLHESDQHFDKFLIALASNQSRYEAESTIRTKQGNLLRVLVAFNFAPDGDLSRVQANVLDITERVKAQEALQHTRNQLDHALRAATIGEVSASIAHEINQPLAAIATHAAAGKRWINRNPPELDEVRVSLDHVEAAAHRASEVVRRVRTLMTRVEPEKAPLAIDPLIEETLVLLRHDIGQHGGSLSVMLEADGAAVEADRVLLQQVLINLISNALQAMRTVPSGPRRLAVSSAWDDSRVLIEVADSGPGFSEQAAQKAFEPFFTTKPTGMGLGLAMCRTIVTAHGGEITIGSPTAGTGGLVRVSLPAGGR